MSHFHLTSPLELKFLAESGVFEGYASVFHHTDSMNDRVSPGAFRRCLADCRDKGRLPPMLWQHDMSSPIGVWRDMREDSHGLFVEGALLVDDITRAREAYRLMRENVVTGLSIGYRTVESHRDPDSGARLLTDIELLEVSLVTAPANDLARVSRVKSLLDAGDWPSEREFEAFLRDAGLSRKQAKGVIAHGYKSLTPRDAETGLLRDAAGEDAETLTALRVLAARMRAPI